MIRDLLNIATPFLLASIGGLFTELAGALNIALEGMMLTGAFFAVLGVHVSGSLLFGLFLGVSAGLAMAALFSVTSFSLKANIFVVGLGTNLLALGFVQIVSEGVFGTKGVIRLTRTLGRVELPFIHSFPVLGDLLSGHTVITYSAWLLALIAWYVIRHTPFGLALRSAGLDSSVLHIRGKNPVTYRWSALLISGAFSGLAGSAISLGLGAYVPNISSGRGWIALVAIYLGYRRPIGVAIACVVFAGAELFANSAQGWIGLPPTITLSFPYFITVISLIAVALGKKLRSIRSSRDLR